MNDKLLAMICLQAFSAFGVFMMRQFYDGIPNELCEAARVDGMSEYKIYSHIMLPLSKPALSTLTIFTFVATWNDYLGPLIYLKSQEKKTIQVRSQNVHRSVFLPVRTDYGRLGTFPDSGTHRIYLSAEILCRGNCIYRFKGLRPKVCNKAVTQKEIVCVTALFYSTGITCWINIT